MKYLSRKRSGDWGEHYFTYWIVRHFNSPCRLLDKDLGIDAKIEFIDNDDRSTGEFVFVQIKTNGTNDNFTTSIALKNLLYWQSIAFPVILVVINKKNSMRWTHINEQSRISSLIADAKSKYKVAKTKANELDYKINIDLGKAGKILKQRSKREIYLLRVSEKIKLYDNFSSELYNAIGEIKEYQAVDPDDQSTFDDIVISGFSYEVVSNFLFTLLSFEEASKNYFTLINNEPNLYSFLNTRTQSRFRLLNTKYKQAETIIENCYDYFEDFCKKHLDSDEAKQVMCQLQGNAISGRALHIYEILTSACK